MERLSVNQKSPKCTKAKIKKPMKVVYISSPVKFTTSASKFRALVQELTGQYSNVADNTDKYPVIDEPRGIQVSEPVAYNSVAAGTALHLDMLNEVLGAHIDLIPPSYFYNEFQGGWLHNINGV